MGKSIIAVCLVGLLVIAIIYLKEYLSAKKRLEKLVGKCTKMSNQDKFKLLLIFGVTLFVGIYAWKLIQKKKKEE